MDLHFCSRCGISIPQSEIDSGSAGGPGGKYFCSEHRGGAAAVAVAESPHEAGATDPELLFCANCRVSIPLADVSSGRAHREFGSLLCAGCSKADPGTRAARREAVEAEMAADVDAQDPVVARRCSVCSAVVPYGQIVTGKAKVEGNRVVCERCRAAADATATETTRRGLPMGVIGVFAIMLVAGGLGYYGTQKLLDRKPALPVAAPNADTKALREGLDALNKRLTDFDTRLAEAIRRSAQPDEKAAADRDRTDAELSTVKQKIADLTAETGKADTELKERMSKLEGLLTGMSERMRDLAARTPVAQEERKKETPPDGGTGTAPPAPEPVKPTAPAVNPQVAKHCKDLLDPNADDGTRFTAATELTTLKDPAAIPSLVKALADDKHYFVRRGCARALGVMRAWLAVPALIKALEDREVYVALAANNALQNITTIDFGVTQDTPTGQRKTKAQAAEKWWDKNRDKPPEGVSLHAITD